MSGAITKGIPRPQSRGLRPHTWKVGPDPLKRKQYLIWLQQKNQAQFRQEEWNLPFEVWLEMWGDLWHMRGRTRGSYCMTRYDPMGPWDKDNAMTEHEDDHTLESGKRITPDFNFLLYLTDDDNVGGEIYFKDLGIEFNLYNQ